MNLSRIIDNWNISARMVPWDHFGKLENLFEHFRILKCGSVEIILFVLVQQRIYSYMFIHSFIFTFFVFFIFILRYSIAFRGYRCSIQHSKCTSPVSMNVHVFKFIAFFIGINFSTLTTFLYPVLFSKRYCGKWGTE